MLNLEILILSLVVSTLSLHVEAKRPIFNNVKRQGAVLAGSYMNNITVAADDVVQCAEATISWTGAVAPVTLMIGFGGLYVGTTPITTIPDIYETQFSWQVSEPSGSGTLVFQIMDAGGAVGYIQNIEIGSSDDTSCLPSSSSTSFSGSQSPSSVASSLTTSSASPDAATESSISSSTKTTKASNSVGSGSGAVANQGSASTSTTKTPSSASISSTPSTASHSSTSQSASTTTSASSVGLAAASSTSQTSSATRLATTTIFTSVFTAAWVGLGVVLATSS